MLLKYFTLISCLLCACNFKPTESNRAQAVSLSQQKQYDQAVAAYWQHIESRLAVKNRPDWENPYIYLLDIGDIYLEQDQVAKALESYLEAEQHGVKAEYVADRMRHVARWYEARGLLREAIEHLKKHRQRDEVLFDLMLTRLARQLVEQEDLTESTEQK